jgi:hypothetical protein
VQYSRNGSYLCILKNPLFSRMGALMGGGVGLTIGFIFGSYSILRLVGLCRWITPGDDPVEQEWRRTTGGYSDALTIHAQQRSHVFFLPGHRIGKTFVLYTYRSSLLL